MKIDWFTPNDRPIDVIVCYVLGMVATAAVGVLLGYGLGFDESQRSQPPQRMVNEGQGLPSGPGIPTPVKSRPFDKESFR